MKYHSWPLMLLLLFTGLVPAASSHAQAEGLLKEPATLELKELHPERQAAPHPGNRFHLVHGLSKTSPGSPETSKKTMPAIPEPMVFDLVRPLGARKGELEVNSLFLLPASLKGDHTVDWAPEVEYAFRDNQAIELELPFENTQLKDIKTTYQVTFGSGFHQHFIHGAQVIGEYNLNKKYPSVDCLYIWGYRFNKKFSAMLMQGLRHTNLKHGGHLVGLLNPTLFYAPSRKFRLGLETNLELGSPQNNHYLFMLQAHIQLRRHHNLQVGAGFQKHARSQLSSVVGIRLVREL